MNCNDEASVAQGVPSAGAGAGAGEGETLGGRGRKGGGAAADAGREAARRKTRRRRDAGVQRRLGEFRQMAPHQSST